VFTNESPVCGISRKRLVALFCQERCLKIAGNHCEPPKTFQQRNLKDSAKKLFALLYRGGVIVYFYKSSLQLCKLTIQNKVMKKNQEIFTLLIFNILQLVSNDILEGTLYPPLRAHALLEHVF